MISEGKIKVLLVMIIEGLLMKWENSLCTGLQQACGISNQLAKIVTHFPLYVPFKIYHLLGSFTTQICFQKEGGRGPASHRHSPY